MFLEYLKIKELEELHRKKEKDIMSIIYIYLSQPSKNKKIIEKIDITLLTTNSCHIFLNLIHNMMGG